MCVCVCRGDGVGGGEGTERPGECVCITNNLLIATICVAWFCNVRKQSLPKRSKHSLPSCPVAYRMRKNAQKRTTKTLGSVHDTCWVRNRDRLGRTISWFIQTTYCPLCVPRCSRVCGVLQGHSDPELPGGGVR